MKDKRITSTTYARIEQAYDFLNKEFFEGQLPDCLITLQRSSRSEGYYRKDSFIDRKNHERHVDEIALNPSVFRLRSEMEILSTLAHEIIHLWQFHYGHPPRGGYHNREWANKMESIGLMPSSTGKVDGKRTGQKMSDYVIANGIFEKKIKRYLENQTCIQWQTGVSVKPKEGEVEVVVVKKKKIKYLCPSCNQAAWAKPGTKLICGQCEEAMQDQEKK